MSNYNPQYVEQLAEEIMAAANRLVIVRTIIWAILGMFLGYAAGIATISGTIGAIGGAAIGGILGFSTAQSVVLRMRAEAQLMLTQLQIEKNTRSHSSETMIHSRQNFPNLEPQPSPPRSEKPPSAPAFVPAPPPHVAPEPLSLETSQQGGTPNPQSRNPRGQRR